MELGFALEPEIEAQSSFALITLLHESRVQKNLRGSGGKGVAQVLRTVARIDLVWRPFRPFGAMAHY